VTISYFDLQGATLVVTASDPRLIDQFARIFDGTRHDEPPSAVCFAIDMVLGEPEPASNRGTHLYTGPVFDEGICVTSLEGDELVQVFPNAVSLRLNQSARTARLVLAHDALDRANASCALLAMAAALRVAGQLPMHCAGLTMSDGRIVLIIGQSGAGKTTSALALCGAGFGLCSDDLMICRVSGGVVTAWGLPRSLKVHGNTVAMLPWTAPLLRGEWSAEDEKALPLAELRGVGRVEDQRPRPVAAVYLLHRSTAASSAVAPISAVEMLTLAASDNLRSSRAGVLPDQADRFGEMAQLIRQVPSYRLVAGRDPTDLGATILQHLGVAA